MSAQQEAADGRAQQQRASFGQRGASNQSSVCSQAGAPSSAAAGRRRSSGSAPSARRHQLRRQPGSAESWRGAQQQQQQDDSAPSSLPSSNADYERVRNETLLFFLDRLYLASCEGKEARTLHELSCLFGTREFSREMRQLVGASRNGLKKFLQSFPTLFQLDGDKVHLTQLKQQAQAAARDYNQEAVDYFKHKLQQFGTSQVPIRNLFGYRSQANQEVRHVSGKNARDFRRFLAANGREFELLADGEHVMLTSVLEQLRSSAAAGDAQHSAQLLGLGLQQQQQQPPPGAESGPESAGAPPSSAGRAPSSSAGAPGSSTGAPSSSTGAPSSSTCAPGDQRQQQQKLPSRDEVAAMDPYLNKRFAHLIEQSLRRMQLEQKAARVSLESLHERIKSDCQNELFLKLVASAADLSVLLRMHPKLFKRSSEPAETAGEPERHFVRLLDEHERRELELAAAPAASPLHQRQHSALESGPRKSSSSQPLGAPTAAGSLEQADRWPERAPRGEQAERAAAEQQPARQWPKQPAGSSGAAAAKAQLGDQQPSSGAGQHALRANAPPFVPHTRALASQHQFQQQHQQQHQHQHIQRSYSNLGPRRGQPTGGRGDQQAHYNQPASLNYSPAAWRASHEQPLEQRGAARSYLSRLSAGHQSSRITGERRESSAKQLDESGQQVFVAGAQQVAAAEDLRARTVDIVREASNIITRIMNTADAVAFDCKGYNLGFDGQITLIQFGFLPTKCNDPISKTIESPISSSANNNNNIEPETPNKHKIKPEVCLFDLITNPELAYCLKPLLESDKIVKIVHDVRNKSNALYVQFKIILNNVFDTQVANLVIQQQDTGKPAYKSRYISMSKLCEVYGDDELLKYRNLIKSKTRQSNSSALNSSSNRLKDVNYWRIRPLTKPMIFESALDVYCLVGGIYQNLKSKLRPEYEPLFEQLNLEGVLARIKPDEIKSAKKGRKIDLEVIDLKRKLYRDATGPIVLSNREIRLLRHVDLTEEVREKIQQCKKVAKKIERLDMKAKQLETSQSINSQTSDQNGQTNIRDNDSSSSTGETSTSITHSISSTEQQLVEDEERILSSFMDSSSMFDELKDKITETSHLLDSIDDSLRTPL